MESELPVFGAKSEGEKVRDFERSTLDLVLGQLGWSKPEIKARRRDVSDDFWGFEWFNAQGLTPGLFVEATRLFKFDLAEAFFRPSRSKLIQEYFKRLDSMPAGYDSFVMIFRVHEWGRMIATSLPITETNHIHASVRGKQVRIAVLDDFFTPWSIQHG